MKKLLLLLLAIIIATGTSQAQALEPTFDVSAFVGNTSNHSGFAIGTSLIGEDWVVRLDLRSAENIGGLGASIGRKMDAFTLSLGVVAGANIETEKRMIDVAGVQVQAQERPDFDDIPVYIEISHDTGWFANLMYYQASGTLEATRYELIDPGPPPQFQAFSDSEDFEISETVFYVGWRSRF